MDMKRSGNVSGVSSRSSARHTNCAARSFWDRAAFAYPPTNRICATA